MRRISVWWLTLWRLDPGGVGAVIRAIEDAKAEQSLAPAADQFEAIGHDPVQRLGRVDHGVGILR
jgi:hypothetical protein